MWGCHLSLSGSRRNDGCGLFVATEGKVICPSVASPGDSMAPAPFDGIPYLCKSPTCANKSPTCANPLPVQINPLPGQMKSALRGQDPKDVIGQQWAFPGFAEVLSWRDPREEDGWEERLACSVSSTLWCPCVSLSPWIT